MDPNQLERDSSINQMMMRGLERSGLLGQLGRLGIEGTGQIRAGLTGSKEESDRTAALRFLDLIRLMDPDNIDPNTMRPNRNFEFQSDLGQLVDLPLIIDNAYKDFEGRGWSKSDVDELGREPGAREASAGDRWVNESRSDANFAEALLGTKKPDVADMLLNQAWTPGVLVGMGGQPTTPTDQYKSDRSREGEVWSSKVKPEGPTTGNMIESIMTPQDTAGWLMHKLGDYPYAWVGHNITGKEQGGSTLFESLTSSTPENRAASREYEAIPISARPSGLLKENYPGWQEKEAALSEQRGMSSALRSDDYDYSHKEKHGEWPSYLKSLGVNLGHELADWGTIGSSVIGGGLGLLGKGLTTGARLANAGRAATVGVVREMATEDAPIGLGVKAAQGISDWENVPKTVEGWTSSNRQDLPDLNSEQFSEYMNAVDENRKKAGQLLREYKSR